MARSGGNSKNLIVGTGEGVRRAKAPCVPGDVDSWIVELPSDLQQSVLVAVRVAAAYDLAYAAAQAEFRKVGAGLLCGSSVNIVPPVDPSVPYSADVIIDCAERRAAGEDVL